MEDDGWRFNLKHESGVGDGRTSYEPRELFHQSGLDESNESCSLDSDSFIFFIKIIFVEKLVSSDGTVQKNFTDLIGRRHELPRAEFAANSREIARGMISSAFADDRRPSADVVDIFAENMIFVALSAAGENDPFLCGPVSASGHSALPVFLLITFESLFDERGVVEPLFDERGVVEPLFDERGVVEPLQEVAIDASTAEEICVVCLDHFGLKEIPVVRLPCSHLYHRCCVVPWLESNRFCPLCRKLVP